jgi:hypothetical protein
MAYVVVVLKWDDGAVEPKVFTDSARAIALYEKTKLTIDEAVGERTLLACEMFKVDAQDVREAARLAKEGKAEPFSSSPRAKA